MSHASLVPTLVATSDGLEFPPPAPQLMQAPVALSVSRNRTSEINNQHGSPSVNEAPPEAAPPGSPSPPGVRPQQDGGEGRFLLWSPAATTWKQQTPAWTRQRSLLSYGPVGIP